jgi:hypothetical protein
MFMALSPTWEVASRSAIHEYPQILGNPKVHYPLKEPSTGPYSEPDQSSPILRL